MSLLLSTVAVAIRFRSSKRLVLAGGIATLAIFIFHAIFEGMRWQMVPVYGVIALLVLVLAWRSFRKPHDAATAPRRGSFRRLASGTARLGLLPCGVLFVAFLPAAFPVFELPGLPSWQGVGVRDMLIDFDDRPEVLTDDPNDRRELLVRAWYPATIAEGSQPEPYFTEAEARAVTEAMSASAPVPSFLNSHATLVSTNSHRDAELSSASDAYPVLVFSHGYGSYLSQNTSLMEHLASLGYVVFSIAHTYDGAVVFPDGRSPGLGDHFLAWTRQSMATMEQTFDELETFAKTTDRGARRDVFAKMRRRTAEYVEDGVGPGPSWPVWLEDWSRFFDVLEELESGARPSIFAHRIDLDRVGLFGMSFGGVTAAEACQVHPRCRGAINIDGGHFMGVDSVLLDNDISRPLMMIYASNPTTASVPGAANEGDFQAFNDFYYESDSTRGLRSDVIRLRIDGTSHQHLTDASLMFRFIPGMASSIPGRRIAEILSSYCRAFFDEYVRGADSRSSLLDGPVSDFPEVRFQTFGHGFAERQPPQPRPESPDAGESDASTHGHGDANGDVEGIEPESE